MAATSTATTVASMISLARFILTQVDRYQRGELTDEQLKASWDAFEIATDATGTLFMDAKKAGGYT